MAFQRSNTAAAATPANESWKARGFLNFIATTKGGGTRKVGSIPLKMSTPQECALAEHLEGCDLAADVPDRQAIIDKRLAEFFGRVQMNYRSAERSEDSGFV